MFHNEIILTVKLPRSQHSRCHQSQSCCKHGLHFICAKQKILTNTKKSLSYNRIFSLNQKSYT